MKRARGEVFPLVDNSWWPLPPDYPDLSSEGKRLARVNACRMQQTPELAVQGWLFFTNQYLRPWVDADGLEFNSGFYEEWKKPAQIHLEMIRRFEAYLRSLTIFPRGGAKTTTGISYVLWKLLTNPQWLCNVYMSKFNPLIRRLFDKVKTQIESNPRILADFGKLAPKRGKGVWSSDYIRLTNFSSLAGFSIDGKLRGPRATGLAWIDDIEQDPEGDKIPSTEAIEAIIQKVVQIIIPTLLPEVPLGVTGTLFHLRSFASYVRLSEEPGTPDYDPRFASVKKGGTWHKVVYGVKDAEGRSTWPELYTDAYCRQMYIELGPARYAAEFENRPMSTQGCVFTLKHKEHEYTLEQPDEQMYLAPFESKARVHW
ncbi:hypothetical protein LCGC14_2956490, partial [marine sediment metagenome]